MVRILPLPEGVSEIRYAAAMRPFKPGLQRLAARKIILKYGSVVVNALKEEGVHALNAFSEHGQKAVDSFKGHGLSALDDYRTSGSVVFAVLPHLKQAHIDGVKRILGEQFLAAGDYRTLKIMLDEHYAAGLARLITSEPKNFKKIFEDTSAKRRKG
ncbi:hypothetical protein J4220_02800 [Candidatus Micrarchaeota archaeon]|nr:hypothetical protein [Candidatus Micrarchaeota archaeon]